MILLTGATGYFGRVIARKLGGTKFRCLVRNPSAASFLKDYGCEIAAGDVADKKSIEAAMKEVDVVVHAAAVIRGCDPDYQKVNVEGTLNIVEAAKSAKVRHFVFISSILAAYPETTAYGRSKLAGEEIVKRSGIPYTIFRVSLVYGDNDAKTIGKLAYFIARSPVIPLVGSGKGILQPVYSGDAASAIAAASSMKPNNRTYYLAGPALAYRELVSLIVSHLRLRRLLLPFPVIFLKPLMLVYGFLFRKSSFNASQIDFLASSRTFIYADASRDLSFNPVAFSTGVKKACSENFKKQRLRA